MVAVTVNASFMDAHRTSAEGSPGVGGMMHVVPVTLLTHMKIYRFCTRGWPDGRLYGGPWWIGVSAYDELTKLAARQARSLRDVARERLAILSEWGNAMDALVRATVGQPLSAWSGTPRTARSKVGGRYGDAQRPDRSITQLYVPGLTENGPVGTPVWSGALLVLGVDYIQ
jgi:hypothetical protein